MHIEVAIFMTTDVIGGLTVLLNIVLLTLQVSLESMVSRLELNDGNKVKTISYPTHFYRHQIPVMAFGTGSVIKGHDVTAYVKQAIETGFDHIDTAARQF